MDGTSERLRGAAEREAAAAVASLAAAERAVNEGHLNTAKVLRAASLAARQRSLALMRASSGEALTTTLDQVARAAGGTLETIEGGDSATADLDTVMRSASTSAVVVGEALASLAAGRDVPESVVAQLLFVCEDCGFLLEAQRPEICPSCGSIAGEFAIFAPFFSGTPEHIARRAPTDALEQLRGDGERMAALLTGDEAVLSAKPATGEWCAKEIAGHMVDIAELAVRRLRATFEPGFSPPAERTILPWKLLEAEDYAHVPATAIAGRFDASVSDLCRLLGGLSVEDWRRKVDLASGRTLAVDVASWVANHNVAHLRQIDALLNQ